MENPRKDPAPPPDDHDEDATAPSREPEDASDAEDFDAAIDELGGEEGISAA